MNTDTQTTPIESVGKFGAEFGERVKQMNAPYIFSGDVPTVPIGFDRREVEELPTVASTMKVNAGEDRYSVTINFSQPVNLMPKPPEGSTSTDVSERIDGFSVTALETGEVTATGTFEGAEFDLFEGVESQRRDEVLSELVTAMALLDIGVT